MSSPPSSSPVASTAGPRPCWLEPLRRKYREMLRLRRGDLDGSIPDPRPAMVILARDFPGVLR
ncbi:MAG: hypothetical protein RMJ98_16690, partial [Myxococcales bacterium]|nr:hypothetical protein [Myxococcales bacterium]